MGAATGLAGANQMWRYRVCFAAGTPLLVRGENGELTSNRIEEIRVGEFVLSRNEHYSGGESQWKGVEETFERFGEVLELHVGGRVIRTTGEHPFFVEGRGWLEAARLEAGMLLLSHDGQTLAVERIEHTPQRELVYNLRVEDFHTYFVGCQAWGWSVWCEQQGYASAGIRFGSRSVASR